MGNEEEMTNQLLRPRKEQILDREKFRDLKWSIVRVLSRVEPTQILNLE